MGSADKFCLRWNDFESNISSSFRDLREKEDFFDVSIAVAGGGNGGSGEDHVVVRAHKVILAACSPLFRSFLAGSSANGHPNPLVFLRGIGLRDIQHVLDFVYHGECNVAQEDLNSFLAVAEDLQIKGLTQNDEKKKHHPGEEAGRGGRSSTVVPKKEPSLKRRDPSSSSDRRSTENGSGSGGPSPAKKRPVAASSSQQRLIPNPAKTQDDDDDIEDVTPVKSEPSTSSAAAAAAHHGGAVGGDDGDGEDSNFTGGDDDEDYGDEDFGQFASGSGGEVAYDDDGNLIQPTPGTSDGSKELDEIIMGYLSQTSNVTGKGYLCNECGYFSRQKTNAKNHVEAHHIMTSGGLECRFCGKVCKTRNTLSSHISVKHRGQNLLAHVYVDA